MRGVPDQKDIPRLVTAGDLRAHRPGALALDRHVDRRTKCLCDEALADIVSEIDQRHSRRIIRLHQHPGLADVIGDEDAADRLTKDEIEDCRPIRDQRTQISFKVDHDVMGKVGHALKLDARRLAHPAACAIGGDQIIAADLDVCTRFMIVQPGNDGVGSFIIAQPFKPAAQFNMRRALQSRFGNGLKIGLGNVD